MLYGNRGTMHFNFKHTHTNTAEENTPVIE